MSAGRRPLVRALLLAVSLVSLPDRGFAQDEDQADLVVRILGEDRAEGFGAPARVIPAPEDAIWSSFFELEERGAALAHVAGLRARRLTLSVRGVRIGPDAQIPEDDAVLDAATLSALTAAVRGGSAEVDGHASATGALGALLVARDERRSGPIVVRDQESAVGAAVNYPRIHRITYGLRAEVRIAPHAAGGYLAFYRLFWTGRPDVRTKRTSGQEVTPFTVVQRFAQGEVRIVAGETIAVRFTAPDGTREWALLRLDGPPHAPAFEGGRTPIGAGLDVLDTAHFRTGVPPFLPWIDDHGEELFEEPEEPKPPRFSLSTLLDGVDPDGDREVPGPHGVQFARFGDRPRDAIDVALARAARVRGVRAVARVDGGRTRIDIPTSPASPFAGARLDVEFEVRGHEGLAGCDDCLLSMPVLSARSAGVAATGRLRVDGTLELEARAETVESSTPRALLARRMVAGYGSTVAVPYEQIDQVRRVVAVRTWVPASTTDDPLVRITDGLRAGAVFPAGSGLPSPDLVHLPLTRGTPPLDGAPVGPDSVWLRDGAAPPDGLRAFRLAGFDLAAPDRGHVVAARIDQHDGSAILRRDGWCGMTFVLPETTVRREGVQIDVRLRDRAPHAARRTADLTLVATRLEPSTASAESTPDRRAERVLRLTLDDLPLLRSQELAAWDGRVVRLDVPELPADDPAVRALRRRARITLPDGSEARLLLGQDQPALFDAHRITHRPLALDVYTSNHQSADLMPDWQSLLEGVTVLVERGPVNTAPALTVDVRGPARVEPAEFTQRVFPPRDTPPLSLDLVHRARSRRLLVVAPDGRLDHAADATSALPWRIVVTPDPPPSEEDDR